MSKIHELKTWPEYYSAVSCGLKTYEVRKDDRGFEVGDYLMLAEYEPDEQRKTGKVMPVLVTHILRGTEFGIQEGYCVMAIRGIKICAKALQKMLS